MEPGTPVPERKTKSKVGGLSIALIILLVVAMGLGVGEYFLYSNLKDAQTSHASLQTDHDQLTVDTNALTSDLEKAMADLIKAQADLATVKTDLATAQTNLATTNEAITGHQADIAKALLYLDVASALFIDKANLTVLAEKVSAVNDPQLTEKFEKYTRGGNTNDFNDWLGYLFGTVSEMLK